MLGYSHPGVSPTHTNRQGFLNPATGTWTTTGSMNVARYQHMATLLSNGQVLVVGGGSTGPSGYTASAELYTL